MVRCVSGLTRPAVRVHNSGANNGHILAFDNVSGLSPWISDTLCRLSTGGGFAVRQLYTDQDEVLFDATRPVILNGIEEVITKPDLADRAIFLTLEQIEETDRRSEKDLLEDFEIVQPRILGALLDAVVQGLFRLPHTRLEKLPRMADFALWATACEAQFWSSGTFWAAYCGNRDDAVEGVLESDLVAVGLRTFIEKRGQWKGTATELLSALGAQVGEAQTRSKEWPQSARALSGRLRRAATFLRRVGVEIEFTKKGSRTIHLSRALEKCGPQPSAPSPPSSNPTKLNGGNGFLAHPMRAVGSNLDDLGDDGSAVRASTVHPNSSKSNDMAAADGMDANLGHYIVDKMAQVPLKSERRDRSASSLTLKYLLAKARAIEALAQIMLNGPLSVRQMSVQELLQHAGECSLAVESSKRSAKRVVGRPSQTAS